MSEADVIKNTVDGPITIESIQKDLAAIGVKPGMVLLVHSSLSDIGWVSGGPVAVILALEEVLGQKHCYPQKKYMRLMLCQKNTTDSLNTLDIQRM